MIRNPNEIATTEKRIRMLIAGYTGIGKTTLALSAPKPLRPNASAAVFAPAYARSSSSE